MHAINVFLFSLDDFKDVQKKDLPKQVVSRFETSYADHHLGGGNNWYSPGILVLPDGELINFLEENELADELFKDVLKSQRLKKALWFAVRSAALDMNLHNSTSFFLENIPDDTKKVMELDRDTLVMDISTQIPQNIAQMYMNVVGSPLKGHIYSEGTLTCYRRKNLVTTFEKFLSSVVPGFATAISTPNDYRCYDLRENPISEEEDKLIVLFVDIHT